MSSAMARQPSPEEIRRLRKRGVFDAGVSYLQLGMVKAPKHKFWDGWVPPEERDDATE